MPPAPTPAIYDELVRPSNAAIDSWNAAADVVDLAAIRRVSGDLASLLGEFAAGVQELDWPADALPHARDLVTGLALEIAWYRGVASCADDEATVAALEEPWSDQAVEAAALLREALGAAALA
jgi:hypothetical protein